MSLVALQCETLVTLNFSAKNKVVAFGDVVKTKVQVIYNSRNSIPVFGLALDYKILASRSKIWLQKTVVFLKTVDDVAV